MPGKIVKKLLKKKSLKKPVKPGIDPKTGYRYGYKPNYLSKGENISLGVAIGGSAAIPVAVTATKKKDYKKKNFARPCCKQQNG